jgi:hypothetical protein
VSAHAGSTVKVAFSHFVLANPQTHREMGSSEVLFSQNKNKNYFIFIIVSF